MPINKKTRRVGDTLHVFLGTNDDDFSRNIANLEKPDGDAVVAEDGSAVWIADVEVIDAAKSGSDQYTWASDGERIKHARTRYTKDAAGKVSAKVLRFIYKKMG